MTFVLDCSVTVAWLFEDEATYLELAARRGVALATLDRRLVQAARRLGVETLPS